MIAMTVAEKILSAHAGRTVRAGDVAVCDVDLVAGTDASAPMAIDYFERMGGSSVFDPARVVFALDHYSPPTSPATRALHERVETFASRTGIEVFGVGEGISHQIIVERGRVLPSMLVVGADSHTVTCGALNVFAVGLGSSDLAAAMLTGRVWFLVPETIQVVLAGERPPGLTAKDVALTIVGRLGASAADYRALEFSGSAVGAFNLEERLVLANLAVEAGAKAAMFPCDGETLEYLTGRTVQPVAPVRPDAGARYEREVVVDVSRLTPRVARPHSPADVVPLAEAAGTPVDLVFIGTCAGGRASDIRAALAVLERLGGRLHERVHLVITPASDAVRADLDRDGSLARLEELGATVTTAGCGACCGTSGVLPAEGATVISTANRNFKARMGTPTAAIYLASPESCAAAAATGRIVDVAELRS